MNAINWFNSLRPAIPMSVESPGKPMSNGELRRHMEQGGILVNSETITPQEELDFPVFSLIFFPKSTNKRTTVV